MSANDSLILCASDRLARELRAEHSLQQRRAGREVWEAPAIFSLRQWVQNQWTATWPSAQLLHGAQELALWESAVRADGRALLAPGAAAREARRADRLARHYRLDPARLPAWTEEQQAFQLWRRKLDRQLAANDWLTAADVFGAVEGLIAAEAIAVPARVELAGFVDPPLPAEQAVLNALAGRGSPIQSSAAALQPAQLRKLRLPDARAQFAHTAWRIRELLADSAGSDESPRILVLLPDVESRRDLLESVFRPVLAPWLYVAGESAQAPPWRFEQGVPLPQHPAVAAALCALEWEAEANPNERISRLLLAASLWNGAERAPCARLDCTLRDLRLPRLNLWHVERHLTALPPELGARLAAFASQIRAQPARVLPSGHAELWRARLDALGWPGAAQDSESFQAVRGFERALGRLAAMDRQLGKVSAAGARRWLGEILRGQRFNPRSEFVQPVQVLALDEASALPCDAVFVLDATSDRFPGSAHPTPYLSLEAQRAAGIPEALASSWLERARRRVAQVLALAPEVTVCMPGVEEQGAEPLPSPLFAPEIPWDNAPPDAARAHVFLGRTGVALELPGQDPVPPVVDPVAEGIRGGAGLLRDYAQAPFYAFARRRLGIEPLTQPPRGLDALRQGNLIHLALKELWSALGDSRALHPLDDAGLAQHIQQALAPAMEQFMPAHDFGPAERQLEAGRVADLLRQWLKHEQRRVDAFRVAFCEIKTRAQVGGLPLELRLDRIDEVRTDSGPRWLVVDYKTGQNAEVRGWETDRMNEPQLPLYASHALLAELGIPQTDGVAFAHLRDGHPALAACTNWRQYLIKHDEGRHVQDWPALLGEWRARLETMVREFLAGEARLPQRPAEHALLLLARRDEPGDSAAEASAP